MNPAKRAILKQSKRGDELLKKRLSFAPSVGTDKESESGEDGDAESGVSESPLSTKNVEEIIPKNLQKTFDETAREDQKQMEFGEPIGFCPNIKKTTWGLCYVRKTRTREVSEQGTMSFKVPVVAFEKNRRPEFVNAMNLGKDTKLKILIVGNAADGDGVRNTLEQVAAKMNINADINLSSDPIEEDIKGTHYYILLYPLDKSTCPKLLSSLIPKLEKMTVCLNINSCILFLPSESRISYDIICPKDITVLLQQYQIVSYTWPRETRRHEIFCSKLLSAAEKARGGILGTSNLIDWGLQRLNLVEER